MSDMEKGESGSGAYADTTATQTHASTNAVRPSRIANPTPLGLLSFASTTFLLSMYNVSARNIHTPNVVVGMAVFCGGLTQFLAGMWDFPRGNVFGATTLSSYGAFWMSYAMIFIPGSGIITAYADPTEFHNAVGMYLIVWMMATIIFIFPVMHRHLGLTILLVTLTITFLLLAVAEFSGHAIIGKAGGVFGLMTALIAYYNALSGLFSAEENGPIRLPLGVWTT